MARQGILIVVSGFSGAGKGTIMRELLKRYEQYALSVSATTRAPREGEEEGKDYFFKTREAFERMIADDELVEYACYVNHYYGTPRAYVEETLSRGRDVILEIEIQGALKIKERFPEALLIFVMPPSADELKRRLVGRGTETMEVIDKRMRRAGQEAAGITSYDYILINDALDQCVEEMHQLIQAQHKRVSQNLEFIQQMKSELTDR